MKNNPIHIIYCGNRFITHGIYLSALSVVKNSPGCDFIFHIITMTAKEYGDRAEPIHESDMPYFEKMIKDFNPNNECKLYDLTDRYNETIGNSKNHKNRFTPFTMLRLFAHEVIDADVAIYLDADTMCNNSIKNFFEYDITNYELGAANDYLGQFWLGHNYFNAGVLYLNLKKIKETKLFEKCIDILSVKKMYFPDQDALNKLVTSRIKLPTRFNDQRHIKKDTVISHYPRHVWRYWDPVRPWEINRMHKRYKIHKYDDLYVYYLENFPWKEMGKEKEVVDMASLQINKNA